MIFKKSFQEVKDITDSRNNEIRQSTDEKHKLNLQIDKLKRDSEEVYNTMNELSRYYEYEKSQMEREHDQLSSEDSRRIIELEENIKELKAEINEMNK